MVANVGASPSSQQVRSSSLTHPGRDDGREAAGGGDNRHDGRGTKFDSVPKKTESSPPPGRMRTTRPGNPAHGHSPVGGPYLRKEERRIVPGGEFVGTLKEEKSVSSPSRRRGPSRRKPLFSSMKRIPRDTVLIAWSVLTLVAALRLWQCRLAQQAGANRKVFPFREMPQEGSSVGVRRLAQEESLSGGLPDTLAADGQGQSALLPAPELATPAQTRSCEEEQVTLEEMALRVPPRRRAGTETFVVDNYLTFLGVKVLDLVATIETQPPIYRTDDWKEASHKLLGSLVEGIATEVEAIALTAEFTPDLSAMVLHYEVPVTYSGGPNAQRALEGVRYLKAAWEAFFNKDVYGGRARAGRGLQRLRQVSFVLRRALGDNGAETM